MRKMEAREAEKGADELRSALRDARATVQEIQDYWAGDPDMQRVCANCLADFDAEAKATSAKLDKFTAQAANEMRRAGESRGEARLSR